MASSAAASFARAAARRPPLPRVAPRVRDPRFPSGRRPDRHRHASFRSASSSSASDPPLRRRRRRVGGPLSSSPADPSSEATRPPPSADRSFDLGSPPPSEAFAPRDAAGALLTSDQYLALASLSPWVPAPDSVARRALEIAELTSDDVHGELGCGDGRMNFAAMGGAAGATARASWGVDVDENVLERCRERMRRRFVPRDGAGSEGGGRGLEFLRADLVRVAERRRERFLGAGGDEGCEVTRRLSDSTVVTMYFVRDALLRLKPYLASVLGGKKGVRIVTIGYEMEGWDASWAERVLDLSVFRYDMEGVSNRPAEWREEGEDEKKDEDGIRASVRDGSDVYAVEDDYSAVDESPALAEYLGRKRADDMDALHAGLEIRHDPHLDDFAPSGPRPPSAGGGGGLAVNDIDADPHVDDEEDFHWDFDEKEDPQELMREAARVAAEERKEMRGRG
ncbi:hypothetical protein ACHAWF_013313, partial [Thalassiosira exigua]